MLGLAFIKKIKKKGKKVTEILEIGIGREDATWCYLVVTTFDCK